jgi:NTP pyrophosphatase (non-canonical NTP hydrolase)
MTQFNRLTPAQHERLAVLSEELGEAQQAIGKILRHGYDCWNPDKETENEYPPDNRADLERELGDVVYAMNLLLDSGDVHSDAIVRRTLFKASTIKPYLHHQGAA